MNKKKRIRIERDNLEFSEALLEDGGFSDPLILAGIECSVEHHKDRLRELEELCSIGETEKSC